MKLAHLAVLYIEQPGKSRLELEAIKHRCNAQPKTP